ncbi:hypothetical protein HB662_23810 [Roseomonas frigidaquae]|uniref:Uncharacterized protein n=1 Tax=Falsiroseomonas frigidaquae TaxID=487318 RepID=A0ABX1F611_9PROT|nr:hypothetical protein [Falsiroseomonas frigidaquae]NKE47823.1 hypothetical protein [Falsiroseomonas frigidaquae]
MMVAKGARAQPFHGQKALPPSSAATVAEAIRVVREALDARDAASLADRRDSIPTGQEIAAAFAAHRDKVTPAHRRMLQALRQAPAGLTATQLAAAAGFAGHEAANLRFGQLGRIVAEDVGYVPPLRASDQKPVWSWTLADGEAGDTRGSQYCWTLRGEVAEALAGEAAWMLGDIPARTEAR